MFKKIIEIPLDVFRFDQKLISYEFLIWLNYETE